MLGLIDMFSGGALRNCAVGALGIMPYISASIILQLLTAVVPGIGYLFWLAANRSTGISPDPL